MAAWLEGDIHGGPGNGFRGVADGVRLGVVIAVTLVMAKGFAVRGDMDQLRVLAALCVITTEQTRGETFSIVQQSLESNGMRYRTIIKKQADAAAVRQVLNIGHGRIDAAVSHFQ